MKKLKFPEAVREARKWMGLTQEEFGGLVKVDKTTVKNWETGVTLPQKRLRDKVVDYITLAGIEIEPGSPPPPTRRR